MQLYEYVMTFWNMKAWFSKDGKYILFPCNENRASILWKYVLCWKMKLHLFYYFIFNLGCILLWHEIWVLFIFKHE